MILTVYECSSLGKKTYFYDYKSKTNDEKIYLGKYPIDYLNKTKKSFEKSNKEYSCPKEVVDLLSF